MPFDLQELPQALQVIASLSLSWSINILLLTISLYGLGSSTTMGVSSTLSKRISLLKLVILLVLDLAEIPSTSKYNVVFLLSFFIFLESSFLCLLLFHLLVSLFSVVSFSK